MPMDKPIKPSPFYTKFCEAEDKYDNVKAMMLKVSTALDCLEDIVIDNRGQPSTGYDEIACDHIIRKMTEVENILK
tara:strand:- start:2021 stop:2248 length:228 start_codon:yes stop_codon:yes gene_type:complete